MILPRPLEWNFVWLYVLVTEGICLPQNSWCRLDVENQCCSVTGHIFGHSCFIPSLCTIYYTLNASLMYWIFCCSHKIPASRGHLLASLCAALNSHSHSYCLTLLRRLSRNCRCLFSASAKAHTSPHFFFFCQKAGLNMLSYLKNTEMEVVTTGFVWWQVLTTQWHPIRKISLHF